MVVEKVSSSQAKSQLEPVVCTQSEIHFDLIPSIISLSVYHALIVAARNIDNAYYT